MSKTENNKGSMCCKSDNVSWQNWRNKLYTRSWQTTAPSVFANKVLLEHGHTHTVHGHFHTTSAQASTWLTKRKTFPARR